MENWIADLKHAFRLLARNPGFTAVVVLALALGIGANTAVFSVMNAVLFKPLQYKDPDRIVSVAGRFTGIGIPDDRNQISPPELRDIRSNATAFSDVAFERHRLQRRGGNPAGQFQHPGLRHTGTHRRRYSYK